MFSYRTELGKGKEQELKGRIDVFNCQITLPEPEFRRGDIGFAIVYGE